MFAKKTSSPQKDLFLLCLSSTVTELMWWRSDMFCVEMFSLVMHTVSAMCVSENLLLIFCTITVMEYYNNRCGAAQLQILIWE